MVWRSQRPARACTQAAMPGGGSSAHTQARTRRRETSLGLLSLRIVDGDPSNLLGEQLGHEDGLKPGQRRRQGHHHVRVGHDVVLLARRQRQEHRKVAL